MSLPGQDFILGFFCFSLIEFEVSLIDILQLAVFFRRAQGLISVGSQSGFSQYCLAGFLCRCLGP